MRYDRVVVVGELRLSLPQPCRVDATICALSAAFFRDNRTPFLLMAPCRLCKLNSSYGMNPPHARSEKNAWNSPCLTPPAWPGGRLVGLWGPLSGYDEAPNSSPKSSTTCGIRTTHQSPITMEELRRDRWKGSRYEAHGPGRPGRGVCRVVGKATPAPELRLRLRRSRPRFILRRGA